MPGAGMSVEQGMDATHGMDVATAVDRWRLGPHPEGGFFRETYRSTLRTVPAGWPGERALATAILYLLPADQESDWHRVRSDELWLWQGGAPMELRIGAETRQVGPGPGGRTRAPGPGSGRETWQSATPATMQPPRLAPQWPPGPWSPAWSRRASRPHADFELR